MIILMPTDHEPRSVQVLQGSWYRPSVEGKACFIPPGQQFPPLFRIFFMSTLNLDAIVMRHTSRR